MKAETETGVYPTSRPAVGCQGGDALQVNKYVGTGDGRTDIGAIAGYGADPPMQCTVAGNPFGMKPLAPQCGPVCQSGKAPGISRASVTP